MGCAQVISDLLKPERQNLTIKEDRRRGVFVDGLSEWVVRSPHEVHCSATSTASTKFAIASLQKTVRYISSCGANHMPCWRVHADIVLGGWVRVRRSLCWQSPRYVCRPAVYHDGARMLQCAQVYGLIERGAAQRATGTTKLNELSSRSHAVFVIIIEKSTLTAPDTRAAALGGEMEQFRGLAPGAGATLKAQKKANCSLPSLRWQQT